MNYKSLVIGADTPTVLQNGRSVPSIDFDNASTKPTFVSSLEAMSRFAPVYTNINGGQSFKALYSEQQYEKTREDVLNFFKADTKNNVVVFLQNTTEAINKLAYIFSQINYDGVILLSMMEHHANILPWTGKFKVDYVDVDDFGRLMIDDLEQKLVNHQGAVKLVAITGASNVTGYINPIHQIATLAHKYKAKVLIDGAQLVPHCPLDMKPDGSPEHIDFLVFSAHKMYAPFGIGALIGPRTIFENTVPEYAGSTNANGVTLKTVTWKTPPLKEEAGTPNIMGVIALQAAIKTLSEIGMETIKRLESDLSRRIIERLMTLEGIEIYCDVNYPRISIIPINLEGIPHDLLTKILADEAAVEVRNGYLSAQPYVDILLKRNPNSQCLTSYHPPHPGMVRISLAFYNSEEEIERFVKDLALILSNKKQILQKYGKWLTS